MKAQVKVTKEVNVSLLCVSAGVRHWEDATVNGVEDTDGCLIPFRNGDRWEPLIAVDAGVILNWPQGITAEIHYKICDDGKYKLLDELGNDIYTWDGYVPGFMYPGGDGYGDYIIMTIRPDGKIENWVTDRIKDELDEENE